MLAEIPRLKHIPTVAPEHLVGDLIDKNNPLFGLIWINPERLSGAPCFYATRVPIKNLFDYLAGNESLSTFLEDFPGVSHEQAEAVIALASQGLLEHLPHP